MPIDEAVAECLATMSKGQCLLLAEATLRLGVGRSCVARAR